MDVWVWCQVCGVSAGILGKSCTGVLAGHSVFTITCAHMHPHGRFLKAIDTYYRDLSGRKLAEAASHVNEMLYKANVAITKAARSGTSLADMQVRLCARGSFFLRWPTTPNRTTCRLGNRLDSHTHTATVQLKHVVLCQSCTHTFTTHTNTYSHTSILCTGQACRAEQNCRHWIPQTEECTQPQAELAELVDSAGVQQAPPSRRSHTARHTWC